MDSMVAKVTYASVSGATVFTLPANCVVHRTAFVVTVAWDGSAPTVLLGVNADQDRYLGSGEVDLGTIGVYQDSSMWVQTGSHQVRPVFEHDSSTAGEAYIVMEYEDVEGL